MSRRTGTVSETRQTSSNGGRSSSTAAVATATTTVGTRRKRVVSSDEEEEAEEETMRRNRRAIPSAANSASPVAAAAAAQPARKPDIPTAAHQALIRFFHVNGRASIQQIKQFYDQTQQHCAGGASKTLPLMDAFGHLNEYFHFMDLEIRRLISEVDGQEYWILVDNTKRVAQANASFEEVEMPPVGDGEDEQKSSVDRERAAKQAVSAMNMAKYLNPTKFTEKQIAFFKVLLDGILSSSSGQLMRSEVRDLRNAIVAAGQKKLTEDEVDQAIHSLMADGWIRENLHEGGDANTSAPASANRRSSGVSRAPTICLGERTHAELRSYIDDRNHSSCSSCRQSCLLGRSCVTQSTESRHRLHADPPIRCDVRMHYHCAETHFIKRARRQCPGCGCEWDKYLAAQGIQVEGRRPDAMQE